MPQRVKPETTDSIDQRLARHKGEIERLIEASKTADAGEKAELRQEIDKLKAIIEDDKKAKEQKEKDEGTGGTLVLPPEQVEQGQQHGDRPGDKPAEQQHAEGNGGSKTPFWKRAW